MALIIEDGTLSTPSANTYATASYVTTFCSDLGLASWATASTANQDAAILRAMAYIDSRSYVGVKSTDDQPLRWPRMNGYDEDGYAIDSSTIPTALKKGLARAAYEENADPGCLLPNLTKDDFITKEKIDVISITYEQGQNVTVFQAIEGYLSSILVSTSYAVVKRT